MPVDGFLRTLQRFGMTDYSCGRSSALIGSGIGSWSRAELYSQELGDWVTVAVGALHHRGKCPADRFLGPADRQMDGQTAI